MLKVLQLTALLLLICATTRAQDRCTETLQYGSEGDCVRTVQEALGIAVDGIFGQDTENAVTNFQEGEGLVDDGIVGPETWAAIYGISEEAPQRSAAGNSCGCSYNYATGPCSGGPTQGARNLANYLKRKFGSRQEIYNCRTIRGSSKWSLHAEGRAVDHYVSGAAGTNIFNHLKSIACQNGIQEVIFNRRIWTAGRGEVAYSGSNPHIDHVHVGLNRCGAKNFNL